MDKGRCADSTDEGRERGTAHGQGCVCQHGMGMVVSGTDRRRGHALGWFGGWACGIVVVKREIRAWCMWWHGQRGSLNEGTGRCRLGLWGSKHGHEPGPRDSMEHMRAAGMQGGGGSVCRGMLMGVWTGDGMKV